MTFRLLSRNPVAAQSRQERDSIPFRCADGRHVEILRVRDPRAKRIKLSVSERGARLTLPMRASLVAGDRFLATHRDWLAAQLDALNDHDLEPLRPNVTDVLPLRGETVPLRWESGRFVRLREDGEGIVCAWPERGSNASMRRALRDFYEAQARADVGRWLPRYLPELPRAPRRIQLKTMSSQWGSLAPDDTLALDLSLVLAPPAAFEYVLVHELCHLLHRDHSPRFWREVEARSPAWTSQRDYFRLHGRFLKSQLSSLLS